MTDDIVDMDTVKQFSGKINKELKKQQLTPIEAITVLEAAKQYWTNAAVKNDLVISGHVSGDRE